MKKITKLVVSTLLFALVGCQKPVTNNDAIRVAIVKQLDHASLDEIAENITKQFDASGKKVVYEVYSGQNDQATIQQLMSKAVNDQVDFIVPIATMAAQTAVLTTKDTNTKVVFAAVSDPETAGLTGYDHVTGTSDGLNVEQMEKMMEAVKPNLKKVGLLYSASEVNSEKPIQQMKEILNQKNIEVVEAIANSVDEVIAGSAKLISANVDAVFTPTDNVIMASQLAIYESFEKANIPHFTGADSFVRSGAFVSAGVSYTKLGQQTAQLVLDIADGKVASNTPYQVMAGDKITVNQDVAKQLGIDPNGLASFGEVELVTTTGK